MIPGGAPTRSTPPWVYIVAAAVVVAALVAVTLIFALHGEETSTAPSSSTTVPTTSAAPTAEPTDAKPSEADVEAGVKKILQDANPGKYTDKQVADIADCVAKKSMATMSTETLNNYAASQDKVALEDAGKAEPIVAACVSAAT